MRISIIGSGYVGLVTGAAFASLGNEVVCIDIDENKVRLINEKKPPIYEEGLGELLGRISLRATMNMKEVVNTDVTFVCVGTPSKKNGKADLKYLFKAVKGVLRVLRKKSSEHVLVVKSSVPPGTTERVKELAKESERVKVCSNPEFLREGTALQDFFKPDRVVIGTEDEYSEKVLRELYRSFDCPILVTDTKTAEMIKYASNAFLSTKISFINEIGNICKLLEIDTYKVADGIGLDRRIGRAFLNSGAGYGGSCFGKDIASTIKTAKELGYDARLLKEVANVNEMQPLRLISLLKKKMDIDGKNIGILGLSFKPETDDIRDSPAIVVIRKLMEENAVIYAYDPKAIENTKRLFPDISYCNSAKEVIEKSDAILILTDWKEFASIETDKPLIEGRRILDRNRWKSNYDGICW